MSRTATLIFWIGAVVLYPLLIMVFQPTSINLYDEALMLVGALQVQHGVYSGSGFFAVYGPLQFFASAGLLYLFDGNILALRVYHVLTVAVTLLALASLFKPTLSRDRSALTALFLSTALFCITNKTFPLYPTHMLSLFGAGFVASQARWPRPSPLGAIVGLAVFLTFLAFLAPISAMIILVMLFVAIPFNLFNNSELTLRAVMRDSVILGITAVIAGCVLAVYDLSTSGSFSTTVKFLIDVQIPAYATHRNLPFPTLTTNSGALIPAYFPLVVLVLGSALYFYTAAYRNRYPQWFRSTLFWLLFFCLAFYPSGLVRTHSAQLWPTLLFAIAATFFVLCYFRDLKTRSSRKPWFSSVTWAVSVIFCLCVVGIWTDRGTTFATECSVSELATPRISCLTVGTGESWVSRQKQIAILEDFLGTDERIFVTTDRHDRIFAADLTYYFLLNRIPLTRWAHLEPGIQTTAPIQRLIVEDLKRYIQENGRAVVLIGPSMQSTEQNLSAVSTGVDILDDYLKACDVALEWGTLKVAVCT
jgi:hypothetical protein